MVPYMSGGVLILREMKAFGSSPVIIIGAHRSGTTATARALRLLGLQIGQQLDSHDESRALQRVHEDYLRRCGAAWYNPAPFLAAIADTNEKEACVGYLRDQIEPTLSLFGYKSGLTGRRYRNRIRDGAPWGWKEPRTTLFADCWLALFAHARFLHVVRNPLAVAKSIQKRELEFQAKGDAPSGRVQEFGYCVDLAMSYVQAAEALAGRAAHYERVRFEDIQADPVQQLRKLAAFCGLHFTNWQIRRAARTIRPLESHTAAWTNENVALLSRYPLAMKFGYAAPAPSRSDSAGPARTL